MDPRELVGRTIDTGREVTQRSQERIESLVGQLQRLSEEQLDQVAALVGELRDRSLLSGEQVAGFVDRRVRAQLAALGIATRADLERVEARLDRLDDAGDASGRSVSGKAGNEGKARGKGKSKGAKHKSAHDKGEHHAKGAKGAKGADAKRADARADGPATGG